jgi:dTDP-4-dehydrorhamnose 3,5-epimerase
MNVKKTRLEGLYIIEKQIYADERGCYVETYSKQRFRELGFDIDFLQDGYSFTRKKNTYRGLHYQINPMSQNILLYVLSGKILDFALDIRVGSPTFGKYHSEEISSDNKKSILITKGFAHGFLALSDDVHVVYKMDNFYSKKYDRVISFFDPQLNIVELPNKELLFGSSRDSNAPLFCDAEMNFEYYGE